MSCILFHRSVRFLHCTIFVSQFKFSHLDFSIPNQIPNAFICLDHFIPPIIAFTKLLNHKPYILFLFRYKPETSLNLFTSERAFTMSVSYELLLSVMLSGLQSLGRTWHCFHYDCRKVTVMLQYFWDSSILF